MIPVYWTTFTPCVQYAEPFPSTYCLDLQVFTSTHHSNLLIPSTEHPQPLNQMRKKNKICITKEDLLGQIYHSSKKSWDEEEDKKLCNLIEKEGLRWGQVEKNMRDRTYKMCYSRYRRIQKTKKQSWTVEEDAKVEELVSMIGKSWKRIHSYLPRRTPKQIRERYINFIRPNISQDDWTIQEDLKLVDLINKYGQKWKKIQQALVVRTQNQIKNRYFSRILKLWDKKMKQNPLPALH